MGALLHFSTDASEINAAINHPAVRPFVGAPEIGAVDISPLLTDENLFPFGEFGGFALIWTAPATREVHTFITPEGRGRWAAEAAREGIAMAAEEGTRRLWTKIPPDADNVRSYAARMGMKATGETVVTFGIPHAIYAMECGSCQ